MDRGIKIMIALGIVFGILILLIVVNQDSYTSITPNDRFFVVSIGESPKIDVDEWELKIEGLVNETITLTHEDITSFPIVSEVVTLKCVAGPQGTANWTGVRLSAILDMAGLKPEAREVVFYAEDGYSSSLEIPEATKPDVILAYEMNGETLPADHGFPVRLVVPGKYGYKWVKWIVNIQVVDKDYKGYWESRGYDDDADVNIISDWWIHSVLLSVATYVGTLSLLSGFRFSKEVKFGKKLPEMFSRKFHIRASQIFNMMLIAITLIWIISAVDKRGNFPNTNHGILALVVMLLAIFGAVTGYMLKIKGKNKIIRTAHLSLNLMCYLLLLGAILTGILIAGIF